MSSQTPTPVLFSYKTSPYAQKIHYILTAGGIPYSELTQPPVLPRPDLEDLGITYRRIPLLAVGRDVYADSAAIIDVILNELGGKHKIETSKADKAYEVWGNDTFKTVVPLLPVQALTPQFVSDRETIFPLLAHPERLKAQQPIALADLKSRLAWVEDVYLADRKEGAPLSLADIHIIWALRWVLQDLGMISSHTNSHPFSTDGTSPHRCSEALPPPRPKQVPARVLFDLRASQKARRQSPQQARRARRHPLLARYQLSLLLRRSERPPWNRAGDTRHG